MDITEDTYPVFEVNQVLTNAHLNDLFEYLDEQSRLTRANLIGIGLGGTATAMVTDFVYGSDLSLHYSLATVGAVSSTLAIALLLLCLGPFRGTLFRLEQVQSAIPAWVEENA